ncbi:hypothetical protein JCM15765_28290 [Paradesulfitobacterium aromaticivorans]
MLSITEKMYKQLTEACPLYIILTKIPYCAMMRISLPKLPLASPEWWKPDGSSKYGASEHCLIKVDPKGSSRVEPRE